MSTKFSVNAGAFLVALTLRVSLILHSMIVKLKRFFSDLRSTGQEVVMEKIIIAKTTSDLKAGIDDAMEKGARRIVIQDRRAKRAHRVVAGIKSMSPTKLALFAAALARGDLITALKILMDSGITLGRVKAIKVVGLKRSFKLGTSYREADYLETDDHLKRKCILEFK